MSTKKLTVDAELERLQHDSFKYFLHETNPANGLVIDKTEANWPASIAATGLALACYPVAAILAGQSASFLSITNPLAGFVSCKKYLNESC